MVIARKARLQHGFPGIKGTDYRERKAIVESLVSNG
jgi:hypothetical protein